MILGILFLLSPQPFLATMFSVARGLKAVRVSCACLPRTTLHPVASSSRAISTSSIASGSQTRSYASIAEQQAESEKLQRAASPPAPAVAPVPASKDTLVDAVSAGRPTAALGFAKHEVVASTPAFDYEGFYEGMLEKKKQDKSYRVCPAPPIMDGDSS